MTSGILELKPELPNEAGDAGENKIRSLAIFLWAAFSAFGAYFCMYGVRVPFKVATFTDVAPVFGGVSFKTILLTAQVMGYTISKFVGIRVIAETKPQRRARTVVGLVVVAELALVGFGLLPTPWNAAMLFFNGLPLGMVFGLVMGFLEGRRQSEAMLAGLCCSFIAADGVTKGLGKWVMTCGVTEFWMPAVVGLMFIVPLLGFVWALKRVPTPDRKDVIARSARGAIDRTERWALFWKYAPGFTLVIVGYLLLTVLRSVRGDFAAEIWQGLGVKSEPGTFAMSEMLVALVTLVLFAALVFIRNNRWAFVASLAMSVLGFGVGLAALVGFAAGWMTPFPFIVLLGIGLYLPYMAVHTTLFERLLAVTRDKGNIGYLMYLVDAFGYLGYVGVILGKGYMGHATIMAFFKTSAWLTMVGGLLVFLGAGAYFLCHPAVRATKTVEGTYAEV